MKGQYVTNPGTLKQLTGSTCSPLKQNKTKSKTPPPPPKKTVMLIICQHEGQEALPLLLFMVFLFLASFKAFKAETIAANVIIF